MGIVDRIKQKCTENNKSINAIEKECGLGHGTIRRWNENSPTIDKAKLVADILQISLEWMITGKEAADLTPEEQKLIDSYRKSSKSGRELILEQAQSISKKLPATELQSSTSRIG